MMGQRPDVPMGNPQAPAPQAPVAVGPQPNNIGSAERARIESQNYVSPYQPVQQQPVQPQQTTPAPAPATTAPVEETQPTPQTMVGPQGIEGTQRLIDLQAKQEESTKEAQNRQSNLNEFTKQSNANLFASTLMEKLGADTVYKMSPHQIAALSAYTFLKLS